MSSGQLPSAHSKANPLPQHPMMHRGKFAILVVVMVAIALGAFSWFWRYYSGKRALNTWGAEAAQLIRHAPEVEILQLAAADDWSEDVVAIGGKNFRVVESRDISDARGLVHYRHALIDDSTFVWAEEESDCQPVWSNAFRFTDGSREALVAVDFECGVVCLPSGDSILAMKASAVGAFEKFINRQFSREDSPQPESS